MHRGPDADDVGGDVALVDDGGRAQLVLELGDLLLEHCLLVLRIVVLGVLGDVPESPRLSDPLRHLLTASRAQVLDLRLQLIESLLCEDDFLRHSNPYESLAPRMADARV